MWTEASLCAVSPSAFLCIMDHTYENPTEIQTHINIVGYLPAPKLPPRVSETTTSKKAQILLQITAVILLLVVAVLVAFTYICVLLHAQHKNWSACLNIDGLTLDPNTASRHMLLSGGNRKATGVTERQPYPDHPDRFDDQVWNILSREPLTGRSYWEAEWNGPGVAIAVAFKSTGRSTGLGRSPKAWSLEYVTDDKYTAYHNSHNTTLPDPPSGCTRAGIYVDRDFGTVSFFWVTFERRIYLHTFAITHTDEPLHAALGIYLGSNSSVSLV